MSTVTFQTGDGTIVNTAVYILDGTDERERGRGGWRLIFAGMHHGRKIETDRRRILPCDPGCTPVFVVVKTEGDGEKTQAVYIIQMG